MTQATCPRCGYPYAASLSGSVDCPNCNFGDPTASNPSVKS